MTAAEVVKAADELREAARTSTPCAPVRTYVSGLEAAYAVQRVNVGRAVAAGRRIVGRKIGLTSPAVQQQLGVDRPDFGVLFADMDVSGPGGRPSGCCSPRSRPRSRSSSAPTSTPPRLHGGRCPRAVRTSPCPHWRSWTAGSPTGTSRIVDTVADNASSGLFVLGDTPRTADGPSTARP
jgi:2-keto-4-pentenoate hydratase